MDPQFHCWGALLEDLRKYIVQLIDDDSDGLSYNIARNITTMKLRQVDKWFATVAMPLRMTSLIISAMSLIDIHAFPLLRKLDLSRCRAFINMSKDPSSNLLPCTLTSLNLTSAPEYIGACVHALTALTKLNIRSFAGVSDATMAVMTQLRVLVMDFNDMVMHIPVMPSLEYLSVVGNRVLTTDCDFAAVYSNITRLDISHSFIIPAHFVTSLPKLTTLHARHQTSLRNKDFCMLTALTKLDVRDNHHVNGSCISEMSSLTYLDIRGSHRVAAVGHFTTLRVLKLDNDAWGYHLNKLPIAYMVFGTCPSRRCVHAHVKVMSNPIAWRHINPTHLTIDVNGTVIGVESIASMTNLRSVKLTSRFNVNDETLQRYIASFRDLPLTHFTYKRDRNVRLLDTAHVPVRVWYK